VAITTENKLRSALQDAGNPMQCLMFEWAKDAPYNALHIVECQGEFHLDAWQSALAEVISTLNYPLLVPFQKPLQKIEKSSGNLIDLIQHELNRPFAPDDFPFRGFMSPAGPERFYFGLAYSHWVADSVAMRLLMKNLMLTLNHQTLHIAPVDQPPANFLQHYRRDLGGLSTWQLWLSALKHTLHYKGAFRTPMREVTDYTCGYSITRLPSDLLPALRRAIKLEGVAVNDAFIAALSRVLGEFWTHHRQKFPDKWGRKGRHRIAIGTIADIRTPDLNQTFGQYLGSYTVMTSDPEKMSLPRLLQQVATQTRQLKSEHRASRSHRVWRVALQCWQREHRPEKNARFFMKSTPIMAGLSNVNLDACEHTQALSQMTGALQPLAYWRVSPTGPLLPLVFTLTTYQGELSLGVTYRRTAYSSDDIHRLVGSFIASLQDYCATVECRGESQDVLVT